MIFDTDILIWIQRGNSKIAVTVDKQKERFISVQTYMELLQCAKNKIQQKVSKDFLLDFNFLTLPLTENIGHRAAIYIEEHSLSTGLRAADAIIAATAVENNLSLCTTNDKHFKSINKLNLHILKP